jgi:hypothetical protein
MPHPYVSSFRCAECSRVFGRQRLLRRHQYFEHRVLPLDGQQLFESQKVPSSVGSGVERAISPSDSPTGKALALNAPVPLASANSRDLPRCQSPPENVLPSPGISVDFPSPSPSAHVTTENSKMGCLKPDTHSTRHVQTESTSTASTGTQTSNTEDLPLDYLRIRPPRPKSRRILFQDSKADLSAVCAPCPKLCQPLDDSLPVARTEELEYIIMASQKDPVSSARLCKNEVLFSFSSKTLYRNSVKLYQMIVPFVTDMWAKYDKVIVRVPRYFRSKCDLQLTSENFQKSISRERIDRLS